MIQVNIAELKYLLFELRRLLDYIDTGCYKLGNGSIVNVFGNKKFYRDMLEKEMNNVAKAIMLKEGNELKQRMKSSEKNKGFEKQDFWVIIGTVALFGVLFLMVLISE